jgi:hypothetical protein
MRRIRVVLLKSPNVQQMWKVAYHGHLAVDPLALQDALRPRAQDDDPLWVLKFATEREWEVTGRIKDGLTTEQMADQVGVQRVRAEPAHQARRALAPAGGRLMTANAFRGDLARSHALTRGVSCT